MLMAIQNEKRISALDAVKYDNDGNKNIFYCPLCHEELILRQGTKNIWHFSHKSNTQCPSGQGESLKHHLMKVEIKNIIENNFNVSFSDVEHYFGDYIGDYYFEINSNITGVSNKIVIECVYKNTNIDHFREKNKYYYNNNIYVQWLFDIDIFKDENGIFKDEYRINEILKEAHTINYGHIYAIDIDNKQLYVIHFEPAERYNEYSDCYYYLKRTKFLYIKPIDDLIIRYISNVNEIFLSFKVKSINFVKRNYKLR